MQHLAPVSINDDEGPGWQFAVPLGRDTPTANSRLHWSRRSPLTRHARETAHIVSRSARNALKAPAATGRRSIQMEVVRGLGQKLLDPDNVVSLLKPTLDGVADAGWLTNDRTRDCDYRMPTQRLGTQEPYVVVVIREHP